jgi:hypothetical protein
VVGQPGGQPGVNVFGGGFLGLDNISPIDRSMLPAGQLLEQSDATGWMARYCIDLLRISLVLAEHDPAYEELTAKFAAHFAVIATAMDELWDEFLSPYGLRSLSRHHLERPFEVDANGVRSRVDYEPSESTTALFGGNSNWRGPIWMPLNYLAVEALRAYHAPSATGFSSS